jgi:hypothetical protein
MYGRTAPRTSSLHRNENARVLLIAGTFGIAGILTGVFLYLYDGGYAFASAASGGVAPIEERSAESVDAELTQLERVLAEARFAVVDSLFRAEPRNDPWASSAEDDIRRTMEEPIFTGSQLDSVVCKSRTCRVEVAHETEHARSAWLIGFPGKLSTLPAGTIQRKSGGNPPGDVAYFSVAPVVR